jgi:hypothetical protein
VILQSLKTKIQILQKYQTHQVVLFKAAKAIIIFHKIHFSIKSILKLCINYFASKLGKKETMINIDTIKTILINFPK